MERDGGQCSSLRDHPPPKELDTELRPSHPGLIGGELDHFTKTSLDRILKWFPADGKIGTCNVKVTPIYKNEGYTIIGGLNFEIKSQDGKILEAAYQINPDSPIILRDDVKRFVSTTKMLPGAQYRQIEIREGELVKLENGRLVDPNESERKRYRYTELFLDESAKPPTIIGMNAKRIDGEVVCGVVNIETRVAYEKEREKANAKKNDKTPDKPKQELKTIIGQ